MPFPKGQQSPRKGVKLLEETKTKISLANKGRPPWNKGKRGWTIGTKAGFQKSNKGFGTEESYKRAGLKKSGEKNGTWQGGGWNYWSKTTKIRDDYTCQICGFREPEIMEVDHIKPKSLFPELRKSPDNLLTLCPNCHRRKTNRERKMVLRITKYE